MRHQHPARVARLAAGLQLKEVARRVGRSPRYLAQVERGGGCTYALARRLARLYGCRIESFLGPGGRTPGAARAGRRDTARPSG